MYQSFSKRQLLAMTWWNRPGLENYEGILCDGAIRSGKTISMVTGFFLWSLANFDGCTFGLCGRTIGALRRNIVGNLQVWLADVADIRECRSENKLVVTNRAGRRNIYYLFGGQDESAYKLIQGITLAGVLLDEAALMPRSFVEQACARCSVSGSKLWFNCNPEGPEHWLYKEWIQKAGEKRLLHLHFTMQDNPALDPAIRARYEAMYTGAFYRRYILGQWCMAEGLVYDFQPEKHITQDPPTCGRYYISVDYGTQNPFSAGVMVSGIEGQWYYRKWSNGFAECWCNFSETVDTSENVEVIVNIPTPLQFVVSNFVPIVMATTDRGLLGYAPQVLYSTINLGLDGVEMQLKLEEKGVLNVRGQVFVAGFWK